MTPRRLQGPAGATRKSSPSRKRSPREDPAGGNKPAPLPLYLVGLSGGEAGSQYPHAPPSTFTIGSSPKRSQSENSPSRQQRSVSRSPPPSRGRPGTSSKAAAEESPRLHDPEQPLLVVGNAVLNPYVPVAPSVQQLVQIVPTLLRIPDTALRKQQGGQLDTNTLAEVSDAQVCRLFSGVIIPSDDPEEDEGDAGTAAPYDPCEDDEVAFTGRSKDDAVMPGIQGVLINPQSTLLCIEEVFSEEKEGDKHPSQALHGDAPRRPLTPRPTVMNMQKLYSTTPNDIAPIHIPPVSQQQQPLRSFTASEILPVLCRAEERVAELAAARRVVDWDVTIPDAETIAPPAIAFLDESGSAVHHLDVIGFSLDSTSLRLVREDVMGSANHHNGGEQRITNAQAKLNLLSKTVGTRVAYENGIHRVHGLVGLMPGLAEQVGLERVMEFKVETSSQELFIAAPYVDADVGDLVLQLNSSIQGCIRLLIKGFDCGSVDGEHVQQSVNQLECVVRVQYSHDAPNHEAAAGPSVEQIMDGMGSADRPDVHRSFIFAATNPHELRYDDARQATREFLALKAEREAAEAAPPTPSSIAAPPAVPPGGIASPLAAPLATAVAPSTPQNSAQSPRQLNQEAFGPCEPISASIAFLSNTSHYILIYLRYPLWQHRLGALLPSSPSPGRAGHPTFADPEASQSFIARARETLGPVMQSIHVYQGPMDAYARPTDPTLLATSLRSVEVLRDTILMLVLQADRARRNQFHEVSALCCRLFYSALSLAAAALGLDGSLMSLETIGRWAAIPESDRPGECWQSPLFPSGRLTLSEDQMNHLRVLVDATTVAMCSSFRGGVYGEAVFYATQRVFSLCILRGAADAVVCEAQRDLAELYLFFGDGVSAKKIAEDVELLAEEHFDVDAPEILEAHGLAAICCIASQDVLGGVARLNKLHALTQAKGASQLITPYHICVIRLLIVYYQECCHLLRDEFPSLIMDKPTDVLHEVADTITGVHAVGDLSNEAIMHEFFSVVTQKEKVGQDNTLDIRLQSGILTLCGTLLIHSGARISGVQTVEQVLEAIHGPVAASAAAAAAAGTQQNSLEGDQQTVAPTEEVGEVHSGTPEVAAEGEPKKQEVEEHVDSSPLVEGGQADTEEPLVATSPTLRSSRPPTDYGDTPEATPVASAIHVDLDTFGFCAQLYSFFEIHLAVWQWWLNPALMKRSCIDDWRAKSERVEKLWGPIHPLTACFQLLLAQVLQNTPHSNALRIARRSLVALKRCTSPRSWYFFIAHRTLSRLYTVVRYWKQALEHSNAMLILSQMYYCSCDVLAQADEDFLGCLLRCPPGTIVRIDPYLLIQHLQQRVTQTEAIFGIHSEALVWPLCNLAEAFYMLRDPQAALQCLQRAVRLADAKGSLFVTTSTLKPALLLSSKEEVKRRSLMVTSVLQTRTHILQLAQVLFTMAAVLESMGSISDAQDCYGRSLALLECAGAGSSLSAIRVYTSVAKLLYSAKSYGDSLGWARKADRLTHSHYSDWSYEVHNTQSLLAVVENRLLTEEGTYVTVNPHNPHADFVELI